MDDAGPKMPNFTYRFAVAGAALSVFLGMSYVYEYVDRHLYEHILTSYGVLPFRFPFVDISGALAAWECARQGVDVILSNPCDVLQRGYTYSPLWMTAASMPLGVADTMAVGWGLDLVFLMSLSLLPPPRRPLELVLVLAATLSTMVGFALERANPDILMFLLALATGLLTGYPLFLRLFGYVLGLAAALVKYYPIMVLVVAFRERTSVFCLVGLVILGSLAVFWVGYHVEIARGLPNIARGPYNTDLFSAQNLPFLLGEAAANATASPLVGHIVSGGLYAILVGACIAIWQRLLRFPGLRASLAALPRLDRVLLVIGSAVIVGCFFAGQSIGYRGVFLLLVMPGLLGISRTSVRKLWFLGLSTSVVVVLQMWGECFRLALYGVLEHSGISDALASEVEIQFWLFRELCWWWTVAFMLAVLVDFIQDSPIIRSISSILDCSKARVRCPRPENPVQRRDLGPRGGRGSRYC
jgi:hypothetical protein